MEGAYKLDYVNSRNAVWWQWLAEKKTYRRLMFEVCIKWVISMKCVCKLRNFKKLVHFLHRLVKPMK